MRLKRVLSVVARLAMDQTEKRMSRSAGMMYQESPGRSPSYFMKLPAMATRGSSAHRKSTAIMGGGAVKGFKRVKWPVAGRMVMWGAIVFPASAIVAMVLMFIFVWTCK